jgi:hypothetical protein
LAWRSIPKARFYNVQLYTRGRKILSLWPSRTRLKLHSRWTYNGRAQRLRPGTYAWVVWPAFGTRTTPRYGRMAGKNWFRVVGR